MACQRLLEWGLSPYQSLRRCHCLKKFLGERSLQPISCEWLVVQSYPATQRDSIRRQVLASIKLSRCMVGDQSLDPSRGRSNKRMNCLSYLRLDFHDDRPPLPSLEGFPYCRNNLSQEFQYRATRSYTRIRSLLRFVSMLLSKA